MRYLFKRLDQQTTTTAHPQWAMGTHRSAPCLHLGGLVTHLDTLIFFEFPLLGTGRLKAPNQPSPTTIKSRTPVNTQSKFASRFSLVVAVV